MSERYVQHISGQGDRWKVRVEHNVLWTCVGPSLSGDYDLYLPKSEYLLCDPPQRWVDVTSDCALLTGVEGYPHICYEGHCVYYRKDFRLRKMELWVTDPTGSAAPITKRLAFIVEKLEP